MATPKTRVRPYRKGAACERSAHRPVGHAPLSFDEYVTTHADEKQLIDMLMGDMERVMEYPKRGFAIEQHVPERVSDVFDRLRARGYDSWLLPA
ncbi:hypothetical protein [Streptomyces sp. NPDC088196]|uniref:hypothetical protein n=1 Tax=Streptomyces sp. NPDC088196 TaxID=3154868 RepID=UPI00344D1375